ncbi:MAG TPA: hypothetical protein VD816_15775 [Ohtaekwangia sp.]|nr:hypothetical protein [Ohtaekwangia sp.]
MKFNTQYLFALVFFGVGIFQITKGNGMEASLYLLAGASFAFNTLATEPGLAGYRKPLVIVTWTLIILTALVFLWVLQFRYL